MHSLNEISYCRACMQAKDSRSDGRRNDQHRPIILETGVAMQSHGSARMRVGDCTTDDGLDLLVGCKLDTIDGPKAIVSASIECAAGSSTSLRHIESLVLTLFGHIEQSSQFCIVPFAKYWSLHIEIIILSSTNLSSLSDMHLADHVVLACRAALCDLRIPSTQPLSALAPENDEARNDQGIKALLQGGKQRSASRAKSDTNAFDLSSHVDLGDPLETLDDLPLCVTLFIIIAAVPGKKSSTCTLYCDATALEAASSDCSVTVAVDGHGSVCSIQLSGVKQLPYIQLEAIIESAVPQVQSMLKAQDTTLGLIDAD